MFACAPALTPTGSSFARVPAICRRVNPLGPALAIISQPAFVCRADDSVAGDYQWWRKRCTAGKGPSCSSSSSFVGLLPAKAKGKVERGGGGGKQAGLTQQLDGA